MAETRHTPGPWELNFTMLRNGHIAVVSDDYGIAKVWDTEAGMRRVNEANARLIAASPTMYEALRYAVDNPEFDSETFDRIARAAIAKAEGKETGDGE